RRRVPARDQADRARSSRPRRDRQRDGRHGAANHPAAHPDQGRSGRRHRRARGGARMKRDLVTLRDVSKQEIKDLIALARRLKADVRAKRPHPWLSGRTLAMIFEKPSLRTRVTFETGMYQLGGGAIYLAPGDIQLGMRETSGDVAANLSRWVDLIVARTFSHDSVVELARGATVPVINGLSDLYHPCQILADLMTLSELRGSLEGMRLAFIGDGNNMVHSWILAAAKIGFDFVLACPKGYEPDADILAETQAAAPGRIRVTHDVEDAARGA